ncbi:MAG: sensor histidine kinase [Deinococcales bacterium]
MKRPLDVVSAFRAARYRAQFGFALVVVFLVVQVSWWIIFQRGYIDAHVTQTASAWALQAEYASQLPEANLPAYLERVHPDRVVVNTASLEAFRERQERYLRMFAFELPFFLLVTLLGLWVIWQSLQSDKELRRRQENFLMAASHELRTPISSLKLLLETLQMRQLPPEKQGEVLERTNLELERLQRTTERVLATARLERDTQTVLEPHDLGRWVERSIELQRHSLEARGARLELHLGYDLIVPINPEALEIVLGNLLDNAIKYTLSTDKPIIVSVFASHAKVFLTVEDRGMGISSKETKYVFDQFYRVGSELTRVAKGLGLGLYLVKALTERMNATVQLESLPVGTRFVLSFVAQQTPALTLEPLSA